MSDLTPELARKLIDNPNMKLDKPLALKRGRQKAWVSELRQKRPDLFVIKSQGNRNAAEPRQKRESSLVSDGPQKNGPNANGLMTWVFLGTSTGAACKVTAESSVNAVRMLNRTFKNPITATEFSRWRRVETPDDQGEGVWQRDRTGSWEVRPEM
jgi:hypothetical protein